MGFGFGDGVRLGVGVGVLLSSGRGDCTVIGTLGEKEALLWTVVGRGRLGGTQVSRGCTGGASDPAVWSENLCESLETSPLPRVDDMFETGPQAPV